MENLLQVVYCGGEEEIETTKRILKEDGVDSADIEQVRPFIINGITVVPIFFVGSYDTLNRIASETNGRRLF